MIRLSKSKLGTYQHCPRQYYLVNYTAAGSQRANNTKTEAMTNGNILHEFFDLYNKDYFGLGTIELALSQNDFYKTNISNFYSILHEQGVLRAEYSEKKLYNEELDLSGIIDAIYMGANGKYTLIDYKTGNFKKYKMTDYRFELMLYVILAERELGIKISEIGMFFTSHPADSFIIPVKPNMIIKAEEKYKKFYEKISNFEFDKIAYGQTCKNCNYVDICGWYTDEILDTDNTYVLVEL